MSDGDCDDDDEDDRVAVKGAAAKKAVPVKAKAIAASGPKPVAADPQAVLAAMAARKPAPKASRLAQEEDVDEEVDIVSLADRMRMHLGVSPEKKTDPSSKPARKKVGETA
jgi:hypothetical protein